ncbi:MAG TPA: thioredoxin family protein [Opitutaceae bacterium]|nr:thioredoxin family protein [Opitutaceae bacterium]
MTLRRLLAALSMVLLLTTALPAQVTARLVAIDTSVQPGHPVRVALRLDHEKAWHTYWKHAGTGYPTTLEWQLPAGWRASGFDWPTPHLMRDAAGAIIGHGYEGTILLPLTLTPPDGLQPGTQITLLATADWLMCKESCMPGNARVSLTLPVASMPPAQDAATLAEWAKQSAPTAPTGAQTLAAWSEGNVVKLAVAGVELREPHFFSDDGLVDFEAPQPLSRDGEATVLALARAAQSQGARLAGVLAYTDADGVYRGLRVDLPIATTAPASAAKSTRGLGALALAFLGGLVLNLMPCVFPVLGIKILGFVNQAGNDRRKVTLHGLAFTLGVLVSFWALAGVLAVLRTGGEQLGWGFQLQSPGFVFALAATMLVFALSLSGVFEFGLGATAVGSRLQAREGWAGSFFTGVLATVVATPCSAPFLAPALGAALAMPTGQAFVVFTAIALGLAAPYLLLSIFPQAVKALPRPGAWMETVKQILAFPLYATTGYLLWVLAGQTTENGLLGAILGLVVIALAAWVYGRLTQPGAVPSRRRAGLAGGLVLLAAGAWLGLPKTPAADAIVWEPWSPERVAALRESGRIIYIDFTARWCATCQTNKRLALDNAEVRRAFRERGVVALKADWTNKDPRITEELARWQRSAVPFNLVYRADRPEPLILPEVLTAGAVIEALRE